MSRQIHAPDTTIGHPVSASHCISTARQ